MAAPVCGNLAREAGVLGSSGWSCREVANVDLGGRESVLGKRTNDWMRRRSVAVERRRRPCTGGAEDTLDGESGDGIVHGPRRTGQAGREFEEGRRGDPGGWSPAENRTFCKEHRCAANAWTHRRCQRKPIALFREA